MFRLKGEPFDLEALVELFPGVVLKKKTGHYVQLSSCDEMPDTEALQHASDELAQMNGIAGLHHGNHRRITIDGITRTDPVTGEFTTALLPQCRIEGRALTRGKVTVRLIKDGIQITAPTPVPTFGEKARKIANKNGPFSKALKYLGNEGDTFPGLYKVWEYIKKGNGGLNGIVRKGWDSRYEIGRFTGSAQEDRHGEKRSDMTAPEMTLPEAQAFIRKLIVVWGKELGW
jgi:hypothetical protein